MHWGRRAAPKVIRKTLDDLNERVNRVAPEDENRNHQATQQGQNLMDAHIALNLSWFGLQ